MGKDLAKKKHRTVFIQSAMSKKKQKNFLRKNVPDSRGAKGFRFEAGKEGGKNVSGIKGVTVAVRRGGWKRKNGSFQFLQGRVQGR